MHRCLGILEIIEAICNSLDPTVTAPSRYCREARGALASLARTSTALSDPALNMLWKTLNRLDPFFGTFPHDLFTPSTEGPGDYERVWGLVRPILAGDLARPLQYALRVKILTIAWYEPERVSEVLLSLSSCWPGGLLFPNLRTLQWAPGRGVNFAPLRIFCPPTLTWIHFACQGSNTTVSLLSTLAASCPGLKHVSLDFGSMTMHVESATSAFICGLQHIDTLHMGAPTSEALRHIAQLPGLKSLELTGIPSPLWDSTLLPSPMFPHLQRLVLGPLDIELAQDFISCFCPLPLVSLHFTLDRCVTAAETAGLFDIVRLTFLPAALRSFTFQSDVGRLPTGAREAYRINARVVDKLSCFREITTVSIMSPVGFDLDDAAVDILAAAWPRLENLTLETRVLSPPIQLTFHALRSLALHCPRLNSLDMEFDATSNPPSSSDEHVVNESLENLNVGTSPIAKPGRVARYVSRLFPNLSSITTVRDGEDNEDPEEVEQHGEAISWHRLWKQVAEHVPEYVLTRQEGQASMQS
ncbi:hypothetical protein DFH06DRAFT_171269 [Mycena polygramma]|nr:hypothetical protein DFH06DRAFT_171269 [Mycena polygramma]